MKCALSNVSPLPLSCFMSLRARFVCDCNSAGPLYVPHLTPVVTLFSLEPALICPVVAFTTSVAFSLLLLLHALVHFVNCPCRQSPPPSLRQFKSFAFLSASSMEEEPCQMSKTPQLKGCVLSSSTPHTNLSRSIAVRVSP
jgi:hypothetical protein